MAERTELLKGSIAKLLSLNVSDREIVSNLKEVGLSEEEATQILGETKKDIAAGKREEAFGSQADLSKEENFPEVLKQAKKELDGEKQEKIQLAEKKALKETVELEKILPQKKPVKEKFKSKKKPTDAQKEIAKLLENPAKKTVHKKPVKVQETGGGELEPFSFLSKEIKPKQAAKTVLDSGQSSGVVLDIWGKGIMATVNSKLSEMEKMKTEIDRVMDAKIKKQFEKEVAKIETVFESQRNLGAESIREAVGKKSKEVEEIITLKVSELKKMTSLNDETIKSLQLQKKENEKLLEQMNSKLSELSKIRPRISSEIDSAISLSKAGVEDFLKKSEEKRNETVQRINRTLELESKIVEGLLNDAKQKVDSLALAKSSEISRQLEQKFAGHIKELDKKIVELEEIRKELDIGSVKNAVRELETFKAQVVSSINKNVATFNSSKKTLTGLMQQKESVVDKQLEILKLKIREFEAFESQFASQIGMQIEQLEEKKNEFKKAKKQVADKRARTELARKELGNIIKNKTQP